MFEILRPIPPISWIPLTILWLGIGIKAKAFIIFFAAFIPCVINSATGIEQTNKTLINVAKTCGASNVEIFFKVGIPSALPIMFAGIRVALGNAWATLVAAEMLAANSGLGYMILMGRNYARADHRYPRYGFDRRSGQLCLRVPSALLSAVLSNGGPDDE